LVAEGNPLLLAVDTSTEMAGLALYNGHRVSELVWHSGRNQTAGLLEQIQYLLGLNRLSLADVGAIGVATGPGTFNGLRVGLSVAKGLGYGRSIPVFGVDTLDATAYPHRTSTTPIRAFVPAGRGRTVFCDYRHRNGRWVRAGEMQNRPFAELTAGLSERTLVIGETPSGHNLDELPGEQAEFSRLSLRTRRPSSIAEIAWRRWQSGESDDLPALEPLYVHGARSAT
jgi:tRNA threonylcarbamoyladenosine biosynthesis protein TsaB